MSHSNQDAEEREFNRVRAIPFERINGCPTWQKYLKLKQHASKIAVGSEVDYDWTLCGAGHKYGLLADILGGEEYEDITGIDRRQSLQIAFTYSLYRQPLQTVVTDSRKRQP